MRCKYSRQNLSGTRHNRSVCGGHRKSDEQLNFWLIINCIWLLITPIEWRLSPLAPINYSAGVYFCSQLICLYYHYSCGYYFHISEVICQAADVLMAGKANVPPPPYIQVGGTSDQPLTSWACYYGNKGRTENRLGPCNLSVSCVFDLAEPVFLIVGLNFALVSNAVQ